MKRLSIRSKVSLWYTFAMIAITFSSIFMLVMLGDTMIQARQRNDLANYIHDLSLNVSEQNDIITFTSSFTADYGSAEVILYDEDRNILRGFNPSHFPENMDFPENTVVTVKDPESKNKWFVCETTSTLDNKTYYLRGIVPVAMLINDEYVSSSLSTTLIILPLIVLVAILGGGLITESAFAPFAKLSELANNIQDGKDLSRRIGIQNSDEFGMLAESFNSLFDRLQKSFEREKQFTDDASHELRTPITVIMSECEYAEDLDNIEEMRESIAVIHKQAKKMSALVNQLLTLSRTDNLSKVLNMDTFNYSELMEIVLEELEIQAKQKNIQLINYIDKNLWVYGDQPTLTRMLINLITNAIKYGNEGGWVKISITKKGDCLIGMVSDNGIGIAPENLSRIFDRFYQVNPSRTESGNGSMGLGLSMVKWIAEAHKGSISAESTVGEGTVFRFELPICVEAENMETDDVRADV